MENPTEIFIPSIKRKFPIGRKIGSLKGQKAGPTLIFFGGMHGNEPSGFAALSEIFDQFEEKQNDLKGEAHAFVGNIKALKLGQRFIDTDLNRLWFEDQITKIEENNLNGCAELSEVQEQIELFTEIKRVLREGNPPFYFFDLHTTSSPSDPFVLINDTMLNRKLAERYPLPIILGIEEYLDGPLLSYMNDQGYVSLGFEAGQHDDPESFVNHKDFILQSFLVTGFFKNAELYESLVVSRQYQTFSHSFFEVRHRFKVSSDDGFKMNPGYVNFSKIKKRQTVALNNRGAINTLEAGFLFMPLYQSKGTEGFFIIKLIPKFWLRFSSFLRNINLDNLLLALPGVSRYQDKYKTLEVDGRIARLISRDLFHLLGYRRVRKVGNLLLYIKRESINP